MFKFNIYIFISLLIVQCIPASPTSSEYANDINNPPDNLTVTTYYQVLQIEIEHENRNNIDGYLLFLMEEGVPDDESMILVDKNTNKFVTTDYPIESDHEFGIQSFIIVPNSCDNLTIEDIKNLNCQILLSDIKTYTYTFNAFPTLQINFNENNLLISAATFQNQKSMSIEYAPDSIYFQNILTYQHTSSNVFNVKTFNYPNFRNEFNNDLDGIFRYTVTFDDSSNNKTLSLSSSDPLTSKCRNQPLTQNIELRAIESLDENLFILKWDLFEQCFDQILLYEVDPISNDEKVIQISPGYFSTTYIYNNDNNRTFVIGGNRFGDKVYKSNPITIN